MGLFTNPVILSDGVGNRTYTPLYQLPDSKSVIGVYTEAAAALAAESKFVIKHDISATVPRHLFQKSIYLTPAADPDSELRRVTMNYTLVCSKYFTAAEVLPEFVCFVDALGEANFNALIMGNNI